MPTSRRSYAGVGRVTLVGMGALLLAFVWTTWTVVGAVFGAVGVAFVAWAVVMDRLDDRRVERERVEMRDYWGPR